MKINTNVQLFDTHKMIVVSIYKGNIYREIVINFDYEPWDKFIDMIREIYLDMQYAITNMFQNIEEFYVENSNMIVELKGYYINEKYSHITYEYLIRGIAFSFNFSTYKITDKDKDKRELLLKIFSNTIENIFARICNIATEIMVKE